MKLRRVRDIGLYKYRYLLGYVLSAITLIGLVSIYPTSLPGGISPSEASSAVASSKLLPISTESDPINAPYRLLQAASIQTLGLSTLSIRLPSMLIGVLTGAVIALMLRSWFRSNAAAITALLAVSSAQFLILARIGTPDVMTVFWTSLLLLCAAQILHSKKRRTAWKIAAAITSSLSLYTPLMIYPVMMFVVAGLLHPHVRFVAFRTHPLQHMILFLIGLILVSPLAYTAYSNPETIHTLAGIPDSINMDGIWSGSIALVGAMISYMDNTISQHVVWRPMFDIVSGLLIILGLARTVMHRHAARSFMVIGWLIILIPLSIVVPQATLMFFVPLILLLAIGVETLIASWYQLFPRNPNARAVALLPLMLLFVSVSTTNAERYFYGMRYDPDIAHQRNYELEQVRRIISSASNDQTTIRLIVSESDKEFYDLLDSPDMSVTTTTSASTSMTIVMDNKHDSQTNTILGTPSEIVASPLEKSGPILWVYKP